jgi:hypothetical protein
MGYFKHKNETFQRSKGGKVFTLPSPTKYYC